MRQRLALSLLASSLMLTACVSVRLQPTVPQARAQAPRAEAAATAAVAPATPSPQPTPSAKPAATPTPAPVVGRLVAGTVRIDASYVVAAGGGSIIASGGGNIIAAGGNLIGQAGTNLIGQAGTNYRSLASSAVPVGTILPAAGLEVRAFSLKDGKLLAGPVLTDQTGGFRLGVPESFLDNLLLKAVLPQLPEDLKAQFEAIAKPGSGAPVAIDEDTNAVSRMIMEIVMLGNLKFYLTGDINQVLLNYQIYPQKDQMTISLRLDELQRLFGARFKALDTAKQKALLKRINTLAAQHTDLMAARTRVFNDALAPAGALAMPVFIESFAAFRRAAERKALAEPGFMAAAAIAKPAEYAERAFDFSGPAGQDARAGLTRLAGELGIDLSLLLRAAEALNGLRITMGETVLLNDEVYAAAKAMLDEGLPKATP